MLTTSTNFLLKQCKKLLKQFTAWYVGKKYQQNVIYTTFNQNTEMWQRQYAIVVQTANHKRRDQ